MGTWNTTLELRVEDLEHDVVTARTQRKVLTIDLVWCLGVRVEVSGFRV